MPNQKNTSAIIVHRLAEACRSVLETRINENRIEHGVLLPEWVA